MQKHTTLARRIERAFAILAVNSETEVQAPEVHFYMPIKYEEYSPDEPMVPCVRREGNMIIHFYDPKQPESEWDK